MHVRLIKIAVVGRQRGQRASRCEQRRTQKTLEAAQAMEVLGTDALRFMKLPGKMAAVAGQFARIVAKGKLGAVFEDQRGLGGECRRGG